MGVSPLNPKPCVRVWGSEAAGYGTLGLPSFRNLGGQGCRVFEALEA